MKQIPAKSGNTFLALVSSLVVVFQPAVGAQAAITVSGPSPILLAESPAPASDLIAVARLSGTADRNGQPLVNGSIIASGDALRTYANSALLLATTPEERLWLGPNTDVKLSKDGDDVNVAMARGTVTFRSHGHVVVTVQNRDGVALHCRPDSPVLAQVSLVDGQQAHVHVQEGSLELAEGGRTILLQPHSTDRLPDHGAMAAAGTRSSNQEQAESTAPTGVISGIVVDAALSVVTGANVTLTSATSKTFTATTGPDGKFTFLSVQPGAYSLHVTKSKYKPYDLNDLTVRAGNQSSLLIQLGGAAGTNSNKTLVWVLVGGGAAAGIGAALAASGGSSHNASPSTVH